MNVRDGIGYPKPRALPGITAGEAAYILACTAAAWLLVAGVGIAIWLLT